MGTVGLHRERVAAGPLEAGPGPVVEPELEPELELELGAGVEPGELEPEPVAESGATGPGLDRQIVPPDLRARTPVIVAVVAAVRAVAWVVEVAVGRMLAGTPPEPAVLGMSVGIRVGPAAVVVAVVVAGLQAAAHTHAARLEVAVAEVEPGLVAIVVAAAVAEECAVPRTHNPAATEIGLAALAAAEAADNPAVVAQELHAHVVVVIVVARRV